MLFKRRLFKRINKYIKIHKNTKNNIFLGKINQIHVGEKHVVEKIVPVMI